MTVITWLAGVPNCYIAVFILFLLLLSVYYY